MLSKQNLKKLSSWLSGLKTFSNKGACLVGGRKRSNFVADFETTTQPDDCRVWGWGLCNVETGASLDDVEIGTDLNSFIERITEQSLVIYFHNLKFDGAFLLDHVLRNGFKHVKDKPKPGEFTTLISNMGQFYSIKVHWQNGTRTEFRDSYKKLPFSVADVAEAFELEESKGEIDYHAHRPIGHKLTQEERDYLARDVLIIAQALRKQFIAGMTKLTVGSDSLTEFKQLMGQRAYDKMFPVLPESMDAEIRRAYRGGFTYASPRFQGKITRGGKVYDVNSLYPSVMYDRLLPYGEPKYFSGMPKPTDSYPLYIVSITFTATIKPNHIPCIQIKGSSFFLATEYQENITEPITMMCTNVDLALWQDHYDMHILSYNGGWLFNGVQGVFNTFIDKWMQVKSTHTGGMRTIAKLQLNSLYGKFATNPDVTPKIPVLKDNVVKLVLGPEETRNPVYTAMGVFITAYARDVTIRAAQKHFPAFAYADTDSLHLLLDSHPPTLDVDKHKLGAWKHEYDFDAALFIRAKAYSERMVDGSQVTHIAGLPGKIAERLTFDDFVGGRKFAGKLLPKRVPGGIVLEDVEFTMNL